MLLHHIPRNGNCSKHYTHFLRLNVFGDFFKSFMYTICMNRPCKINNRISALYLGTLHFLFVSLLKNLLCIFAGKFLMNRNYVKNSISSLFAGVHVFDKLRVFF